jgi:hypothetical protein
MLLAAIWQEMREKLLTVWCKKEGIPPPPPLQLMGAAGARFTNFQELFLTQILNTILNRLRIDS